MDYKFEAKEAGETTKATAELAHITLDDREISLAADGLMLSIGRERRKRTFLRSMEALAVQLPMPDSVYEATTNAIVRAHERKDQKNPTTARAADLLGESVFARNIPDVAAFMAVNTPPGAKTPEESVTLMHDQADTAVEGLVSKFNDLKTRLGEVGGLSPQDLEDYTYLKSALEGMEQTRQA